MVTQVAALRQKQGTHTLTFSRRFYQQIKAVAAARGLNLREFARQVFKQEVEFSLRRGEVTGPLFEGPIGEAPKDYHHAAHK